MDVAVYVGCGETTENTDCEDKRVVAVAAGRFGNAETAGEVAKSALGRLDADNVKFNPEVIGVVPGTLVWLK